MSFYDRNAPNAPLGLVYFKSNNSQSSGSSSFSMDTSDFLSFSNSSSNNSFQNQQNPEFNPLTYSSPKQHYYNSKYRENSLGDRFYSPNNRGNRQGKFWRKNSGLTRDFTQERERNFNAGYSHDRRKRKMGDGTSNHNNSIFYDPTCIEDPWLELEQSLSEKEQQHSSSSFSAKSDNIQEPNSSSSSSNSSSTNK